MYRSLSQCLSFIVCNTWVLQEPNDPSGAILSPRELLSASDSGLLGVSFSGGLCCVLHEDFVYNLYRLPLFPHPLQLYVVFPFAVELLTPLFPLSDPSPVASSFEASFKVYKFTQV